MRLSPVAVVCVPLAFAVAVPVLSSAGQGPINIAGREEITIGPHPRDMVQVREGSPFVVPPNRVFVLTGFGITTLGNSGWLTVNGERAMSAAALASSTTPSIMSVSFPFTVPANSVIDVGDDTKTGTARAWGYLIKLGTGPTASRARSRVPYQPDAADVVQIKEGTPFTVPRGKLFVLTAVGNKFGQGTTLTVAFTVNGVVEATMHPGWNPSIIEFPTGFTAPSGSVVSVAVSPFSQPTGRVWGYLADE